MHNYVENGDNPQNFISLKISRPTVCYGTLQRKLCELITTIRECVMNVRNVLFKELNNFRALALGSRTAMYSNCETGRKHSTSINVDHEHSQIGS